MFDLKQILEYTEKLIKSEKVLVFSGDAVSSRVDMMSSAELVAEELPEKTFPVESSKFPLLSARLTLGILGNYVCILYRYFC